MSDLRDYILKFVPGCEQEENDKKLMIQYLDTFDDCLTRENEIGHFTSSCFIVNKARTKVLMIYHNIYNSWSWVGGHADGDSDLAHVALKEANEETGIEKFNMVQEMPISLEIISVDSHIKRGKFVSTHVHLNVTYLLEASEEDEIRIKPDENSGIQWVDIEKMNEYSSEEKMKGIYTKIINRIKS